MFSKIFKLIDFLKKIFIYKVIFSFRYQPILSIQKIINLFLLILTLLFFPLWASAEGSRELVTYGGHRPYLEFKEAKSAGILRQGLIRVFVKAGEQVNVGSSVPQSANDDADIVYRWPPGTPPELADGSVGEGSFDVDAAGCGLIDTVAKEAVGPLPKPGGYTPCTFIAKETGIYEIVFHAPIFTKGGKVPAKTVQEAFPIDKKQGVGVAAWDITVFKTPNDPETEQKGRVYANYLPMDMGGNNKSLNSRVFFLSNTGYLYRANLNGIDPYQFVFFSNNKGFKDAPDETGKPVYRSVEFDEVGETVFVHDPGAPDTTTDITHKMFFNPPAEDLPLDVEVSLPDASTTWLRSTQPQLPNISNFKFLGDEGTLAQTGTRPLGGKFSFESDTKGHFLLTVDANNNGIYGDGNDRVLIEAALKGENVISWDGLDGKGEPMPAQTLPYNANLSLMVDDVHFPFLDPEHNPPGLIVERVNCETRPCTVADSRVYYNNEGLTGGVPPDPISATGGVDSSEGAQRFEKNFGNNRGIDTWTSLGVPQYLAGGFELKQADVSISKTHDTTIPPVPGGPITYVITVHNAGPSDAPGIRVQDSLPPTVIKPFWTCETTDSEKPEPAMSNRCASDYGEGPIDLTVDLQKGASATLRIDASINAAEGETLSNSVTLTRPNDVTNPQGQTLDVKVETAEDSVTLAPPANDPPVATDKSTSTDNDTPVQLPSLEATDPDGTVASYHLFQLPSESQGLLYLGEPAAGGTLITEGQKLTPDQISNLFFKPNLGFEGKVEFKYTAIDDQGAASNMAQVTITVTVPPVNQPPVADNKTALETPNDTTRRLPPLSATDSDGKVTSYTITTLPPENEGVLYLGNPTEDGILVLVGQQLIPSEVASLFLVPNTSFTGESRFTYIATDNQGAKSNTATVTIPIVTLNEPPTALDKVAPSTTNRVTVQLPALEGADTDGTVVSYRIATIPAEDEGVLYLGDPAKGGKPVLAGQTLTPAEAEELFFKPHTRFSGEVRFAYTAKDNHGAMSNTATVTFPVTAVPNNPPLANNDSVNTDPNTPVTIAILNNDSDSDDYLDPSTVEIQSLPSKGRVSVTPYGEVIYTPNPDFTNGSDTFTYQVCDTGVPSLCDTAEVTVNISSLSIQQPPVAENKIAPPTPNTTTAQLPSLAANDPDGSITSYTVATLPPSEQGTLYLGDPAAGGTPITEGQTLTPEQIEQLFFKPETSFTGEASFTYTATDDLGAISNPALVTIPVTAPSNSRPVANDVSAITDPNTPVTINILKNDSDPEGGIDQESVTITELPSHGRVTVNPDGSVIYTPNSGFTNGTDVFTYQVCDTGTPPQCDTAQVTVTVPALTKPPVAENKTAPPTPNNITAPLPRLSASDDGTITSYTIKTLPPISQGVLYLGDPTEGGEPMTPGQDLTPEQVDQLFFQPNPSFTGNATFTYTATDDLGNISSPAIVTIPVTSPPANKPPIAGDNQATTNPEIPVTLSILNNDSDPEGSLDTDSVTITSLPSRGRVNVNGDGTVTYKPNPGFTTGTDTFTYEVCDAGAPPLCDTAQVVINVPIPADLPPVALHRKAPPTPNNQTVQLPPLLASDSGTVVSYTITRLPPVEQGVLYLGDPAAGGTPITAGQKLTPEQTNQIFFRPDPSFIGNASFAYTATDNVGGVSDSALFTLPVTAPPNSPPIANDRRASTNPETPVTISILSNDSDPDGNLDPKSVIITTSPTNGNVIVNSDGTVTYTPNPGFTTGTDVFTYQICDTGDPKQCDTATVKITVPVISDQPPIAVNKTAPTTPNNKTVQLPTLSASDNEIVTSYTIKTLPPAEQGVLYLGDPASGGTPLTVGQVLTPAQVNDLFFEPNLNFVGQAQFTYTATDNQGAESEPATVTIPVSDVVVALESSMVTLTAAITGKGQISSTPTGVGCDNQSDPCNNTYQIGSEVSLISTPESGWVFEGWTGHCDSDGQVTMDSNKVCRAIFVQETTPQFNLTIETDGGGTIKGTVGSQPTGIDCGLDCSEEFANGSKIKLIATPEPGFGFVSWSGDCSGTSPSITITIDQVQTCQANFGRDNDNDGTATAVEDAAPNGGDGNNDGIPDSQQNNVVSLPTPDGKYITIEETKGCTINNVQFNTDLSLIETDYYSPNLLDYELDCQEAKITIYYHGVTELDDKPHRQYVFTTPGDPTTAQWQEQPMETTGTILIENQPVATETFTLSDGQLGDNTEVDGKIVHTSGQTITPGRLQLSLTNENIDESGNLVTVTVKRIGGCEGRITVDYSTLDDTATPNVDYLPTSGTLIWEDGDCSDKTFTITIQEDTDPEDNETFNVNLSNPTGGATLATPEALVTIVDNDTVSTTGTTTCTTSTCTTCYTSSTCQVCCPYCQPLEQGSDLKVKALTTTIKVGETTQITLADGNGDLLIKEIPNQTFVSLDAWKPLNTGAGEITLTGLSVGETKMVISDSAAPLQTVTLYITVIGSNSTIGSGLNGTNAGFGIQAIQTTITIDQRLDMTVAGGQGELSVNEIPDPSLVLLDSWIPLGDTGTAQFSLVGNNVGKTKMVIIDRTNPPQKTTVNITVVDKNSPVTIGGQLKCDVEAMGIDIEGNPVESQACFTGEIITHDDLQPNHRMLTYNNAQAIKLLGEVFIDPTHVGQAADILVVKVHTTLTDETRYTRDGQTWVVWDDQINHLPAAQHYPQLPEKIEFFIEDGDFSGVAGELTVFVGYRLEDRTVIYNGNEPIHFFVGNSTSIDPQQGDLPIFPFRNDIQATSFFEPFIYNQEGKLGNGLTFDHDDGLSISTFVRVDQRHIEQPADILMVAIQTRQVEPLKYTRTGPLWHLWDERLESLSAVQHYHQLPETLEIPVDINSLMGIPGEFVVYVGYRLKDGVIVFNGYRPIHLTIANGIALDTSGQKLSTTTRFISWTHQDKEKNSSLKTLSTEPVSLSTTILVEPRHWGQLADIRMVAIHNLQTPVQHWGDWDEQAISLEALIPDITLEPVLNNLLLFEGQWNQTPGDYTIYIGYFLANGDIIYNGGEPLRLEVSSP